MKKLCSAFALYFIWNICISQITFLKTYDLYSTLTLYGCDKAADGGFMLFGNCYLDTGSVAAGFIYFDVIIKTDGDGNMLWSRAYIDTLNNSESYEIHSTPDGGFLTTSFISPKDPELPGVRNGIVRKLNAIGDLLWSNIYEDAHQLFMTYTNDGGYICHWRVMDDLTDMYVEKILKVSADGEELWAQTCAGENYFWNAQLSGDDIILAGFHGASPIDTSVVLIMNAVGEIVQTKEFYNYSVTGVQMSSDNSIVLNGFRNGATGFERSIIKLNEDLDTVWTRKNPWQQVDIYRQGYECADANYTYGSFVNSTAGSWTWVLSMYKISPEGDSVWNHMIEDDTLKSTQGYTMLDDNRFAFVGRIFHPDSVTLVTSYLLVTDSEGYYQKEGGTSISVPENNFSEFTIYPNPATDHVNIKSPDMKNISLEIYSLTGQCMTIYNHISSGLLDISELDAGIFLYNILQDGIVRQRGKLVKI